VAAPVYLGEIRVEAGAAPVYLAELHVVLLYTCRAEGKEKCSSCVPVELWVGADAASVYRLNPWQGQVLLMYNW